MTVNAREGRRARTSCRRPDVAVEVYSLATTARKFNTGYTVFREQMLKDALPVQGFRIGGRWLFRKAEVDAFLGVEQSAEDAA